METPSGKQFKTTQYIRAAHGTAERNWPFITCSDSAFTEVLGPEIRHNTLLILFRSNGRDTKRLARSKKFHYHLDQNY